MNITALTKALKFACLPTLSLLLLLFFAFFSISDTIAFISSNDGVAIALRVLAFIGEVIIVSIYYDKYRKEEILEGRGENKSRRSAGSRTDLYELKSRWDTGDTYYVSDTEDDNIVYVERIPRSSGY